MNNQLKKLAVIFVLILISLLSVFAQQSDDWVRVRNGKIPTNAVKGGYETDGRETYVCRTSYRGSYIGGKALDDRCYYNPGSGERSTSSFEVLIGSSYRWSRSSNLSRAVTVGGNGEETFYVCRASRSNGLFSGRTENGRCFYTMNNRGYESRSYEILQGSYRTNNLLDAASRGDYREVQDALREGQAINEQNSYGQTALMIAAEKGFERVVSELLYERATIDLRDKKGNTALMIAAGSGHGEIVRLLLRDGANFYTRNDAGDTAFTLAASNGRVGLVRDFLRNSDFGRIERLDLERGFLNAAYNGHTDVLQILLDEGAEIETRDSNGRTALMQAADGKQIDAMRFLLRQDANPSLTDNNGYTAFLIGVLTDSNTLLRFFYDEMRIEKDEVERGLFLAARNDKRDSIEFLLKLYDVNVNAKESETGYTALMYAAGEGHQKATEMLIRTNANVNLQNFRGETALMLAAANSKNNTTKVLIKAGADLNLRDNNGLTALGWAIRNEHKDTRKELQKAGAKQ